MFSMVSKVVLSAVICVECSSSLSKLCCVISAVLLISFFQFSMDVFWVDSCLRMALSVACICSSCFWKFCTCWEQCWNSFARIWCPEMFVVSAATSVMCASRCSVGGSPVGLGLCM